MLRKIELYILSLWFLFLFIIILNIDIPFCFHKGCSFIGFDRLLIQGNIIAIIAFMFLIVGTISYFRFDIDLGGAGGIPFQITKIESINYEHLTFLTTYVIPLVCFNFVSARYLIVFVLLLVLIGVMYVRTDQFYANPTLALLGFHIYKVDGDFKNNEIRENIILITKCKLLVNQKVSYIKLDERIYYVRRNT